MIAEGSPPIAASGRRTFQVPEAWREPLLAVLVAAVILGLQVLLVPTAPDTGDGARYLDAVLSNFERGGAAAWHERRILSLGIVRILPFGAYLDFHVLTIAASFATAILTWLSARSVGLRGGRALASIGLLCGTWAIAPNLREYALVDPLAWTFVAALWLAMLHRQWWLAVVLAAVGVTAKEMVAVPAVAVAAAAFDPHRPRETLSKAVLIVLAAWATVLALVAYLPGSGTDVGEYVTDWWANGLGSLGPARVVYYMLISQGAFWILLPLGFKRLSSPVQRATLVLLLGGVALVAVGTPERMLAIAFPAVITAVLAATAHWSTWRVWLLAVACTIFVTHVGGGALSPVVGWTGAVAAVVLAVSAYRPLPWLRLA